MKIVIIYFIIVKSYNIYLNKYTGLETHWLYTEWNEKVQQNFEKYFWISTTPLADEPRPDLVHRRGIYKDCLGATQPWTDYQLRCNYSVAMVIVSTHISTKLILI